MRFRGLAVFPLLYAALFIAVAWWLGDSPALTPFVAWQKILVRILAVAGCFLAVSAFDPGDHLRRAWQWLGWGTIAILVRDLVRLLVPAFQAGHAGANEQAVLNGLGVLSNLGLLVGIVLLARSWKMAAIAPPGGRAGSLAVALITAAVAIVVAGPAALEGAKAVAGGDWTSLMKVVSAAVDIITLCLIAPLLLTAVSLRGGLFSWPWGLVTASQICWLLYDAAGALSSAPVPGAFPTADIFRGMAENYLFVAGLAQLWVVRHVRQPSSLRLDPASA
jgi:hypothetical protein